MIDRDLIYLSIYFRFLSIVFQIFSKFTSVNILYIYILILQKKKKLETFGNILIIRIIHQNFIKQGIGIL